MKIYLEATNNRQIYFCKMTVNHEENFIEVEKGIQFEAGEKKRRIVKEKEDIDRIYEEILKDHLDDGYMITEEPTAKIPSSWQKLIDSADLKKDVTNHFSYLLSVKELEPYYNAIMDTVNSVSYEEGKLVIEFETATMRATPPRKDDDFACKSESFKTLLSHHETLEFPQKGWALHLGNLDLRYLRGHTWKEVLESSGFDEFDSFPSEDDIHCPFINYGSYYFYSPTIKNSYGEPALFLAEPQGQEIGPALDWRLGDLYVWHMAEVVGIDFDKDISKIVIPKVKKS